MASPYLHHVAWARLVLDISVVAFAVGELSQAFKVRRGASRTDVLGELVFRGIFFAGILMLPIAQLLVPAAVLSGPASFLAGSLVGWLGLLLRWWSFATLGRYFTTVIKTSADQVVVEHGPYRVLRHPSYTGLLAAVAGVAMMLGNWVGVLASFAVILAGLVHRIRREERALADALGEAYLDFASDRARLVPFVW